MSGADGQQRLEPLQPVGPSQSHHCRTGWVDGQQRSGLRILGCGEEFGDIINWDLLNKPPVQTRASINVPILDQSS